MHTIHTRSGSGSLMDDWTCTEAEFDRRRAECRRIKERARIRREREDSRCQTRNSVSRSPQRGSRAYSRTELHQNREYSKYSSPDRSPGPPRCPSHTERRQNRKYNYSPSPRRHRSPQRSHNHAEQPECSEICRHSCCQVIKDRLEKMERQLDILLDILEKSKIEAPRWSSGNVSEEQDLLVDPEPVGKRKKHSQVRSKDRFLAEETKSIGKPDVENHDVFLSYDEGMTRIDTQLREQF